jgi:hypothetical protein
VTKVIEPNGSNRLVLFNYMIKRNKNSVNWSICFLKKNMNYNDQNEKNVFQKKKNYKVQFLYNPTLNDKIKKKNREKRRLESTWVGMLNMQPKS